MDRADLAAGCEIETDRDPDPDGGERSGGRRSVGAMAAAPTRLAVAPFARARDIRARDRETDRWPRQTAGQWTVSVEVERKRSI